MSPWLSFPDKNKWSSKCLSKGYFRSVQTCPWTWGCYIWNNANTIRRSTFSETRCVKIPKIPKPFWRWRQKCRQVNFQHVYIHTFLFVPLTTVCILIKFKLFHRQRNCGYDEALSKYTKAVTNLSESSETWNNIGMCFFGKHKYVAVMYIYI